MIIFLKNCVNIKSKEKVKNKNKYIPHNIDHKRSRKTMYHEMTFTGRIILTAITKHVSAGTENFRRHRNQNCLAEDLCLTFSWLLN